MRRLASAACIITTADRSGAKALVATSVTSASLDPPAVLFCVKICKNANDHVACSGNEIRAIVRSCNRNARKF